MMETFASRLVLWLCPRAMQLVASRELLPKLCRLTCLGSCLHRPAKYDLFLLYENGVLDSLPCDVVRCRPLAGQTVTSH